MKIEKFIEKSKDYRLMYKMYDNIINIYRIPVSRFEEKITIKRSNEI